MGGPLLPDREFLYRRISEAMVEAVAEGQPGRVLDVGSGGSRELLRLAQLGWQAHAADPSVHMLGFSRLAALESGAALHLVRAIGERLPFANGSLDAVACQEALDHFADAGAFMKEATRVLKPDGRCVVSLANFDGLACRLGRPLHPLARRSGLHHCGSESNCWQIPLDHTFKGNWQVIRHLGEPWLTLDRAFGVSLLCMVYGWGHLLKRLPASVRGRLLRLGDRIAYGRPSWADVIVSVWRPVSSDDSAASY